MVWTGVLLAVSRVGVGFGPGAPPEEVFNVSTPSKCQSSVWVGTDTDPDAVFFTTLEPSNFVYRVDGRTGHVVWQVSMGGGRNGMRCSPVVSKELLHIGTDNGTFTALDVETGARVWSHTPATTSAIVCFDDGHPPPTGRPCEVYSSALLHGGYRFQGSEDNNTRCFNASTGALLWVRQAGADVDGTAVTGVPGSNTIWIGADDGFLYNLDMATGKDVLPPVQHCGTLESMPAVDAAKGILFSMCRERTVGESAPAVGKVFALDMRTGKYVWNLSCAGGGVPIYVPESNSIFVAGENGTAFAADASTGSLLWVKQLLPLARFMGPFVYDSQRNLLYGANFNGYVYALDAGSGAVVWRFELHTPYIPLIPVPMGPRISADFSKLYFAAYDRALHALDLGQQLLQH
jgi:outer membrane protein assembly factor BamB